MFSSTDLVVKLCDGDQARAVSTLSVLSSVEVGRLKLAIHNSGYSHQMVQALMDFILGPLAGELVDM